MVVRVLQAERDTRQALDQDAQLLAPGEPANPPGAGRTGSQPEATQAGTSGSCTTSPQRFDQGVGNSRALAPLLFNHMVSLEKLVPSQLKH
ncbi:UNVERIFIED_CONTAM: hypothetical protein K2H54_001554 [Gekko kuhli]